MAQMYGNIINGVAPVALGTAVPHGLATTSYCVFGTQRFGANVKVAPRLFSPVGVTRIATACEIVDASAPGPGAETDMDVFVVSEHSLVDVGPVVTGAVRNATTQVRNNRRAYRSLHTQVQVPCVNGQVTGTVDVVHRLNSTDVLKFVFPNEDPWDPGGGGAALCFWCTLGGNANTIVVHVARQDGAMFAGVANQHILVDVMIMTGTAVGHSMPLVPMFTAAGLPGAIGDYDNGDRPALARRPSYWAGYHNMAIAAAAGDRVHRLRVAPTMVMVGPILEPGAFVAAWGPAAAPTLNASLGDAAVTTPLNGNCVLVLSPYSPLAVAYP